MNNISDIGTIRHRSCMSVGHEGEEAAEGGVRLRDGFASDGVRGPRSADVSSQHGSAALPSERVARRAGLWTSHGVRSAVGWLVTLHR